MSGVNKLLINGPDQNQHSQKSYGKNNYGHFKTKFIIQNDDPARSDQTLSGRNAFCQVDVKCDLFKLFKSIDKA